MNKFLKFFWILILATCLSQCSGKEEAYFFDNKDLQQTSERNVRGELEIADQISLYDQYNIFDASSLFMDENTLLITDRSQLKISRISTNSFKIEDFFAIPEGQGPEELQNIYPLSVTNGRFVFYDNSLSKIQFRDRLGNFIREFVLDEIRPSRILLTRNENLITLSDPFSTGKDYMFHEINHHGKVISEFGRIDRANFNTLMYPGSIEIDENGSIYYAGFAEHILKKWDAVYRQVFSVSSIDDLPADLNYVTFESGDNQVFGYSEHGVFSAIGSALYNNFWLVLHGGISGDEYEYPKLDIYSRETGEYLYTYEIPYRATGSLAVDGQFIYMIHMIDDDEHLVMYENTIQ